MVPVWLKNEIFPLAMGGFPSFSSPGASLRRRCGGQGGTGWLREGGCKPTSRNLAQIFSMNY